MIALVSSLAPDLDESRSLIGKKVWPISFFLRHRGILHSVLPLVFLLLIPIPIPYRIAVAIGYASHLLLDSLTPMGIRPFWPLRYRIKGFIRTGSLPEYLLSTSFIFISTAFLFSI